MFKSLIIIHLMVREGEPNVTLKYISEQPSKLAISNFSDGMSCGLHQHYKMVEVLHDLKTRDFPTIAALIYCDTQSRSKEPTYDITIHTCLRVQRHTETQGSTGLGKVGVV